MANAQTYIYIHVTWLTKYRQRFLQDKAVKHQIIEHIKTNAIKKRIQIDTINAVADHVHALIRLKSTDSISETVRLIKGESSYWIRRNIPDLEHFIWQPGYDARTISIFNLETIRKYINNQEARHA